MNVALSFELSNKLVQQLYDLHNEFAQCYALLQSISPDERDALHHYARISMIGASTRIENALLTDPEIYWMDTILTKDGKVNSYN